jgi:SAM-dependent methyltransferase
VVLLSSFGGFESIRVVSTAMEPEAGYDSGFFAAHRDESRRSAELVLPHVFGWLRPASVVDVGCGLGTWLAAAGALGAPELLGIDGDYVERAELVIPSEIFEPHDLAAPLRLERRFDLAMSMEVAEHLPPERAESFVGDLTSLADAVLFSAAVPLQRGQNHLNEQWPGYWAGLFADRGFESFDAVRPLVWDEPEIKWWYRQNTFLAARDEPAAILGVLVPPGPPQPRIHPELWLWRHAEDAAPSRTPGLTERVGRLLRGGT